MTPILKQPASGYFPIEDYWVIGDLRSAGLIAPDGSLDWLCLPRFDSASVFARILDAKNGGSFIIEAIEPYTVKQEYQKDTNVVDSHVRTASGAWTVTDWMTLMPGPVRVNRRLVVTQGLARIRVRIALRPGYGQDPGDPVRDGSNQWKWSFGENEWCLLSDFSLTANGSELVQDLEIPAGTEGGWALGLGLTERDAWHATQGDDAQNTATFWRQWIGPIQEEGEEFVAPLRRSALVLKLMTYAATGAIVAAPTTSLPEDPGGVRNWDYRYTWLRDASMTIIALQRLGHATEGKDFFQWMLSCCSVDRFVLHPVVPGQPVEEWEHPTWTGYEGARPVRIGNAAASQRQLDVYGEVLEAAWQQFQSDSSDVELLWPFLRLLVDEAASRWEDPDEGIWETRGAPQHFVYSKAQCWVALARGIQIAGKWRLGAPVERWQKTADRIQKTVLDQGFSPQTQSFMQTVGGTTWDASVLLLPQLGIIAADDPRMQSTIDAVRRHLTVPGDPDQVFLYRYHGLNDGLEGSEHAFLLCSTWLIGTLALAGRVEEATGLLQRLVGISSNGLFGEEYDPVTGRFWGNFPQAFTHLGIITAILHVQQARVPVAAAGPLDGCRGWVGIY